MHCKSTLAANVTCNPPFKGTPPHEPLFRRSSQSNLLSRASLLTNITWGCPPTVISLPRYLSTATSLRGCPISLLSRPSLPLFVHLLESLSMQVFSRLFCLFWWTSTNCYLRFMGIVPAILSCHPQSAEVNWGLHHRDWYSWCYCTTDLILYHQRNTYYWLFCFARKCTIC